MIVLAAVLAGLSVWLVFPDPGARLRRLGASPGAAGAAWQRIRALLRKAVPRAPDPAVGAQLPGTLDLLAACLAAGAPMRAAVETVLAVSEEETREVLSGVAGQLRLGISESDAWRTLAEDHWWGQVGLDVARSARSGTSLVGVLRAHAEDMRRQAAADRTKQARAVGVRSVLPLMVCFLPAFVLVGVVPIIAGLIGSFLG